MNTTIVRQWPYPTRNMVQLQFSSIEFSIAGLYWPWISEISYDQTLEPGEFRGTSPYVMGVTQGELKATASITIPRIMREQFINICENGSPGWMDKFVPFQWQYQEYGWDSAETDSTIGRITGSGHEYTASNGALLVKLPMYVPYVLMNGHIPLQGIAL